ncbi:MAG: PEP-CTERM sorting domain-containing protein [Opitutaceae bacterium]
MGFNFVTLPMKHVRHSFASAPALAVLWLVAVSCPLLMAQSVVSVADNTGWSPWKKPDGSVITDVRADQHTGQTTDDFVGNATTYAFQQKAGTINGINSILFRARMSNFGGVNDPGGNGMNLGVGFNLDNSASGSLDLIMVMSVTKQKGGSIRFGTPGAGANDGPSTTTWTIPTQTPVTLTSFTPASPNSTTATFYIQSATAVDSVKLNGRDGNQADSWVTFAVSFTSLENAARNLSNGSFSTFTMTYSTAISMVGFTSTQNNALNQDLAGVTGGLCNNVVSGTFASLGASTTPLSASGTVPVPEPSTYLMISAMLAPAVALVLRRRRSGRVV